MKDGRQVVTRTGELATTREPLSPEVHRVAFQVYQARMAEMSRAGQVSRLKNAYKQFVDETIENAANLIPGFTRMSIEEKRTAIKAYVEQHMPVSEEDVTSDPSSIREVSSFFSSVWEG